jgi:hypothetical protein
VNSHRARRPAGRVLEGARRPWSHRV